MFNQVYKIKNSNIVKWCFVLFFLKVITCMRRLLCDGSKLLAILRNGMYELTGDFQILVVILIYGRFGSSFFYTHFIIYERLKEGCEYNNNLKCFLLVFHADYEESEHCRIFFIINWQMLWVFNLQNSQLLLMNNKMLSFVCHVGMEEASIDCRKRVM